MMMQSRSRIHADPAAALAAAGDGDDDRFDSLPDSLVLLIFNRLADVRSLGRCAAVSRRFNALVPLADTVAVKIDRIITPDGADGDAGGVISLTLPKPRRLFSHLLKLMLLAVLKPFVTLEPAPAGAKPLLLPQLSHHSPAQVLRGFSGIRSLAMDLPVADVGVDDGVLLKWKAEFGATLQSCVILGGTRVVEKAVASSPSDDAAAASPESEGSIPESFYTNGGLKLRVVWTISSLIAASTRHYLLREILKEHPRIEKVLLTDAHGQGMLAMGAEQVKEFREKPLAASAASANRTQVPACNMKLRYAPFLELPDGTRIQGATLVTIRPVGGESRKEMEAAAIAGAFDGPFREAAKALAKRRTYLLEMNGF